MPLTKQYLTPKDIPTDVFVKEINDRLTRLAASGNPHMLNILGFSYALCSLEPIPETGNYVLILSKDGCKHNEVMLATRAFACDLFLKIGEHIYLAFHKQ